MNSDGETVMYDGCLTPWDVQSRRVHSEHSTWPALYAGEGGGHGYVMKGNSNDGGYVVRRLTPIECERLQGFPDGWTDLTGCDVDAITDSVVESLGYDDEQRKKLRRKVEKWSEECPDSPRYKAMGNSMTTYVIELIGRRIQAYDELHYDEVGLGWKEYE